MFFVQSNTLAYHADEQNCDQESTWVEHSGVGFFIDLKY